MIRIPSTGSTLICSRTCRSTGPIRSGAPTSPISRCAEASFYLVRVATRLVLKYNIRAGGDHHLGPQVLLAVELDALFDGDEADLAMDQRFHDLDHLPAVGDGFHGSVQ